MNINHYEVKIVIKPGLISKEVGNFFTLAPVEIIAENPKRYCLRDEYFTTVEKEKCAYRTSLDIPGISSSVNDNVWGTALRYSLYTFTNKRKSTIRRHIAEYIDRKYGAFSAIDLSFLVED